MSQVHSVILFRWFLYFLIVIVISGKVLVHCFMGISRSSTCAIAYLMIKKQMTIQDAVRQIRSHRDITPNDGFLCQLVELNQQLQANLPTWYFLLLIVLSLFYTNDLEVQVVIILTRHFSNFNFIWNSNV